MFRLRYGKLINRETYEEIDLEREFPDEVPVFKAFLLLQEEVKMMQDGMIQKQKAAELNATKIRQLQDVQCRLENARAEVTGLTARRNLLMAEVENQKSGTNLKKN